MSVIEQAPQYTLTCQDDGRDEKYQLTVQLPGVESASELDVVVRPGLVSVRVPGRYKLELPMNPPVHEKPEVLRFVKKKSQLKAVLVVDVSAQGAPAAPPKPAHAAAQRTPKSSVSLGAAFVSSAQEVAPHASLTTGMSDAKGASRSAGSVGGRSAAGAATGPGLHTVLSSPHFPAQLPFASAGAGSSGAGPACAAGPGAGGLRTPGSLVPSSSRPPVEVSANGVDGGSGSSGAGSSSSKPSSFPRQVHDSFYQDALGLTAKAARSKAAQQQAKQQPLLHNPTPLANGSTGVHAVASGQSGVNGAMSAAAAAVPNGVRTAKAAPQAPQPTMPSSVSQARDRLSTASKPTAPPTATPTQAAPAPSKAEAMGGGDGSGEVSGPGPSRSGANRQGSEELYATAKQLANREAARQWLERALAAARQGDAGRARVLLDRAVGLCPQDEDPLTADYNARCDPDHRIHRRHPASSQQQQQQQRQQEEGAQPGRSTQAGSETPLAGAAAGASSSASAGPGRPSSTAASASQGQGAKRQQQQQQADTSDAPGQGGRPSEPYAYSEPASERACPESGPANSGRAKTGVGVAGSNSSSGAAGSSGPGPGAAGTIPSATTARAAADSGPGCTNLKSEAQQRQQQQARTKPGAQQQQGPQSGQSQAQGQAGPSRGGPQQQQQQQHGSTSFKSEPRARPPPSQARHRSGGGAAEDDTGGGGEDAARGIERWDWCFTGVNKAMKRLVEPYIARGRPAWMVCLAAGLYGTVFWTMMLPRFTIYALASLMTWLYDLTGYRREAAGLELYCHKYFRWMFGCAVVTGIPIAAVLYACSGMLWVLYRMIASLVSGLCRLFVIPPLWLGALQTVLMYGILDPKTYPLPAALAPLPLLCSMGGTTTWRLVAGGVYLLANIAAPGRTRAAVFAGAAVFSWRSLLWYQALPAMLLEFIVWLMMSAAASEGAGGGNGGAGKAGARAEGTAGGSGPGGHDTGYDAGGEGWGRGRHEQSHELPRGGRLEPELVKGATGEIARVLSARDYFSVLGLPSEGPEAEALTDEAVKSAFRRCQLRVHPDKAGPDAVGAAEASQRVNQAYTLLQTADGRKRLLQEMKTRGTGRGSGSRGAGGSGGGTASTFSGGPHFHGSVEMQCWGCNDVHIAKLFTTDRSRARYCYECRTYHGAHDNEMWIWEDPNAFLFPERKLLVCLDGVVLDITEMGHCCKMFHDTYGKRLPANTHGVQYKLGTPNSKTSSGPGQFRGRGDKGGSRPRKGKRR